jgi:predicted dehydrogenase
VTGADQRPLRVAIAGAGLMGRWHAHAARRAGAEIIAVADLDSARAARIAPATYTRLQDLLAATTPDVLHLCTPTETHGALLRLTAEHGVHAFAEKPLATDLAETQALLDGARAAGTRLCPVHQYAFQSSVETILRDRNRVGDPVLIELAFFSAGAVGQPVTALAGVAADILPHPLSILQRLCPGPLPAASDWQIAQSGAATFVLQTVIGGALARITISLAARPTRATLDLYGTKGAFAADLFHDYLLFRDGAVSRRSKMTRPLRDGAGHFTQAALNLAGRAVRREAAYPGLATLCARLYESLDGNTPGPIPAAQIIEVAALRDAFLAQTSGGPR